MVEHLHGVQGVVGSNPAIPTNSSFVFSVVSWGREQAHNLLKSTCHAGVTTARQIMATIRKRDGKYQVQIRRQSQLPISKTFLQRADAVEWARHMEVKADRGELPAPVRQLGGYTLRHVIEQYRNEVTSKKRSKSTETYILNAFLRQPLANLTLLDVTPAHFSTYRDKRLKLVKPGTVNRELSIIKHALDIAKREWGIPLHVNPLADVKKLKVRNARNRRLSDDELSRLQESIGESRNLYLMPLIRFALATGMRRGEILMMRWDEIDLVRRTLHIPITKNGHPRTIPLSATALVILNELLAMGGSNQSGQVFPVTSNAAKLSWQRLVHRAGIHDLHFHDLRHEAISHFFERGLSVPEVALISGHRDYQMLFR